MVAKDLIINGRVDRIVTNQWSVMNHKSCMDPRIRKAKVVLEMIVLGVGMLSRW